MVVTTKPCGKLYPGVEPLSYLKNWGMVLVKCFFFLLQVAVLLCWQSFVNPFTCMNNKQEWVKPLAKAGLTAKGLVYCLVGIIAFMARFRLGGKTTRAADTTRAARSIEDLPAGKWILLAVGVGLLCYALWRVVEAFTHKEGGAKKAKQYVLTARYLLSGVGYLFIGIAAIRMVLNASCGGGGNTNKTLAAGILSKPFGQWMLGLVALIMAGVGIYQVYYALSEKYKKHISGMHYSNQAGQTLLKTGKVGYVARGIVWVIISWTLLQAALNANAAQAGDTAQAFGFLQEGAYGSLILGAIAAGFFCYGVFCFVRARHERFD